MSAQPHTSIPSWRRLSPTLIGLAAMLVVPSAGAELANRTFPWPEYGFYRWVGGDGDWNDPSHWLTEASTPVPVDHATAIFSADDEFDRTITFPGHGGLPSSNHVGLAWFLEISNAGSGLTTLRITDGTLSSSEGQSLQISVGRTGQGRIIQTTGQVLGDVSLGDAGTPWTSGQYQLLGGDLEGNLDVSSSISGMIVDGGVHRGEFVGVSHAGGYELRAGQIFLSHLGLHNGRFRQTGGQASIDNLWLSDGSLFQWSGGDLTLGSVQVSQAPDAPPSRMVLPSAAEPITLNVTGIADLGRGDELINADHVHLNLGPESLVLVQPDGDVLTKFASVTSQGFVHTIGQTLTIPAGRTIRGAGNLPDPVDVRGRLLFDTGGYELTVPGLTLHPGAEARGVHVNAAGPTPIVIHGGTFTGSMFTSPEQPTPIIQHDGDVRLYELSVGGDGTTANAHRSTFELSGGTLEVAYFYLYGGRFTVLNADAAIILRNYWQIASGGQYAAVPGTTITLDSCTVDLLATDSRDVAGLAHTTLVFRGRDDYWSNTLETMGLDLGPSLDAFRDNYTLDGLVLADTDAVTLLTLVDHFDNHPDADGPEALYVKNLVLEPGTILELQGVNIYYQRLTDLGGTLKIIGGGGLTPVGRLAGDFSGDGRVDAQDINPFILALTDADAYATAYPWLDLLSADLNGDGRINLGDISPFVAVLSDQGIAVDPQIIPEPSTLLLLTIGAVWMRRRR